MNRTMLAVTGAFSASSLLLVDSAIKGTALLVLASIAALILRRDSAATRYLVWLLAIVAMLVVPVLSAVLPGWRVLPGWVGISPKPLVAEVSPLPFTGRADASATMPQPAAAPVEVQRPTVVAYPPATDLPNLSPSPEAPTVVPPLAAGSRNWLDALPLVWAIGFCVLVLRLMAARLLLWNSERRGTVIVESPQRATATHDPLAMALEAACKQLGIGRPVTLVTHPDKTIPVVWGVFRCRLMLPAAARQWSEEQLRSVLLHELAHIKRLDTAAQLLAQIACAVHWFNPLVWFAAWRLGVERERACDDLVLANGVRPSTYAGHLLNVVTGYTPGRWTQSCGLAMARTSSLEGRLSAVLSGGRNRRGVTRFLAAAAVVLAAAIVIPLAMLRAAGPDQPEPEAAAVSAEPEVAPAKDQPNPGAQLKPATEQKLKWGEPANGLRMALAWPPSLGEPGMGDAPEFYLVVQNVSEAAVRLTANDTAPNPRRLMMRDNGSPLSAIRDPRPMAGDWRLQPREAALLRLFHTGANANDGRRVDAVIEQDIRVFPQYSLTAQMSIENAPSGAWTGELVTGQTRGSVDVIPPKHKAAQALYRSWTTAARADGKIPGGVIALLGESVRTFIKHNPTYKTTPQLEKMLPRFDASRDWIAQEAVTLLDELAELQDTPIKMALDDEYERTVQTGAALPPQLADAPWGEALPNGLRLAYLLEPRAAEHRLGTPLKGRILIHNAGKQGVVFRARTWHQCQHKATDANGADINIVSSEWTTIGRLVPFRLAPGEFVEMNTAGIGIGANENIEDWQNTRVGSWIEAKAGDEVIVTPGPVPLFDRNETPNALRGEPRWWLDFISSRLSRHLPFPADKAGRELLLYRIAMELFGTPVSAETNAAFVADTAPTALDSLAKNLFHNPGPELHAWAGPLQSGPTRFRVLPADPDAAKRPRTASNPGRYTISEKATLQVSRRGVGERIVNEAYLSLSAPTGRYELELPDGYATWAASWVRGGSVLWVSQKGLLRIIDFTKPAEVKETRFEADQVVDAPIPPDIRQALGAALPVPDAPQPETDSPRPASPASEGPTNGRNEGAQANPPGEGEIVFITRTTQRPFPMLDAGDGVTLEIHEHVFHGSDVHTTVRIRWPAKAGDVMGHDVDIATDAFANREKWAIGWLRGTKTFWHVSNDLDVRTPSNTRLHRTTFENPQAVVTDFDANYPGEPIDGLGVPPALRATFEQFFGITQPKIVDKSGGLPDVSGRFIHASQPVKADGSLPEKRGRPSDEKRWKVQFVDRDNGKPAPGVRVRLYVRSSDGSESYDVVRLVFGNEVLEPSLSGNQFAFVEVVDENFRGGGASHVFGNVPKDWLAAQKHTDPDKPFVVKVWPTSRDPKPADDALWKTKTPFEKIPIAIINWSAEQNGLRIGMRALAEEVWHIGDKVKVELWVHNPSSKDIWLVANPGRSDVGLIVSATDSAGREHFAENGNVLILAIPMHCVLPAGHVAKVKDFTLSFDTPDNQEIAWYEPKFRALEPGKYKLRCTWSDAHPLVSGDGQWTGALTTGEQEFTLAAQVAPK